MTYIIQFTRAYPDAEIGPKEFSASAILITDVDRQKVSEIIKEVFSEKKDIKGAMIYKRKVSQTNKEAGTYGFILDSYAENAMYDGTTGKVTIKTVKEKDFIKGGEL